MRRRNPYLKSSDYKAEGIVPGGLSGRDLALRMSTHPEHETGENERARTRRGGRITDGLQLFVVPPWHRDALCAGPRGADLPWFGSSAGRPSLEATFRMERLCAECPVWEACLEEVVRIEVEDRYACVGFRAGLRAEERRQLIPRLEKGTVYFGVGQSGPHVGRIKIGTTRLPVATRAAVHRIEVIATEPGSFSRERELHERFADLNVGGEWFRPGSDLIDYIVSLPDALVASISAVAA